MCKAESAIAGPYPSTYSTLFNFVCFVCLLQHEIVLSLRSQHYRLISLYAL